MFGNDLGDIHFLNEVFAVQILCDYACGTSFSLKILVQLFIY